MLKVMHNRLNPEFNNPWYNTGRGYVTLLSVIIVGAVAIAVTVSILLTGTITTQNSLMFIQSNQAQALSHACAEEGLQKIREQTYFSGTGGLTFGSGTCTYNVVNLGGTDRNIVTEGKVGDVVRREFVNITNINPTIDVVSWQEVES